VTNLPGRVWRWTAAALLAAAAVLEWVAFAWFSHVPRSDSDDHLVLRFCWHHTTAWWTALTFAAASVTTLALLLVLAIALVLRLSGVWRGIVTALNVSVWLANAAYLSIAGIVLSIVPDHDMIVLDSGAGDRVALTRNLADPGEYDVWVRGAGDRFIATDGPAVAGPLDGSCRLVSRGAS